MSALDGLSKEELDPMMPGLVAIFSFKGWMAMVWGLVLMTAAMLPYGVRLIAGTERAS